MDTEHSVRDPAVAFAPPVSPRRVQHPVVQAVEQADLLDSNTVTADQLKRPPGIGEAVSEKIIKGAETNKRPFWTTIILCGRRRFVRSRNCPSCGTVEEGRKRAFENAKVELMNFAQVTDLEAKGLVIETQMTFEEAPDPLGMIAVYQLLRVPAKKLIDIQGHRKPSIPCLGYRKA